MIDFYLLYIPFWLNLYKALQSIAKHYILLYIPFWLNLYEINKKADKNFIDFTFHSG